MSIDQQELEKAKQKISPLAKDKTYGERIYDFVFNNLINFWVNLIASAAFTYWVSHSKQPIKLPFISKEFSPPSVLQGKIAGWIHDRGFMGVFDSNRPDPTAFTKRERYASNAANVFTLVSAGHPILIGSVWLGAKIKTPFVKFFDKMHYGKDGMNDAAIKLRHAKVEAEERPTIFGAVLGRLGSIVATQFTVYSIGNPDNWFKALGRHLPGQTLKNAAASFPGMDHLAEVAGNKMGEVMVDLMPQGTRKMDEALRKDGKFGWSNQQTQNPNVDTTRPYQNAALHMGKYFAQDILYTIVTSSTISPAINLLKRFVPFVTFKPKVSAETRAILAQAEPSKSMQVAASRDQAPEPKKESETPRIEVSQIKNVERVTKAPEHAAAVGVPG